MKKSLFVIGLLWGALVFAADAPPEQSPRLFIHLVDYLAIDYPGAIENGKIISELEYAEMKEFSKTLIELADKLPELKGAANINEDLKGLQQLILNKADPTEVAKVAGGIKWKVIGLTGIALAPANWPDQHRGQKLFSENCAFCHGKTGLGDGPSGKGLDPLPSNFHDDARMDKFTSFNAFNAIRLGVPGTAMAQFTQFTEAETWDLAFYVMAMRYQDKGYVASKDAGVAQKISLVDVATKTDEDLLARLPGTDAEKTALLASIRLRSAEAGSTQTFVEVARTLLTEAKDEYAAGRYDGAMQKALLAYLNGVEPIEPRLRATAPHIVAEIETAMMAVRSSMDRRAPVEEVNIKIATAMESLAHCESALSVKTSPTTSFFIAAGVVLREAFEAILLLITLLGVLRSVGSKRATAYVHAGWISALLTGVFFWIFSGWVMQLGGASREIMEGSISLLAVGVVLYVGFWLHQKTEIGRWRAFIDEMVNTAVSGKRLILLFVVAYMAVFREAFETVLFLRAILIEAGPAHNSAVGAGVVVSLVITGFLGVILLKYSAKIPVRKLFDISAVVMVVLAVMLVGKGIHSFQEAGVISATEFPLGLRSDIFGIYPTYESIVGQLAVLATSLGIWILGKKPKQLRQQLV